MENLCSDPGYPEMLMLSFCGKFSYMCSLSLSSESPSLWLECSSRAQMFMGLHICGHGDRLNTELFTPGQLRLHVSNICKKLMD